MFTGLIEEVGRIAGRTRRGSFQRLEVKAERVLGDLREGDSVNLDGVCQTVVEVGADRFAVESVEETLRRTTLGELAVGRPVNLERALRADSRLGGHLVLGHVDGVGKVAAMTSGEHAWVLRIEPPPELGRYLAEKGSVAVDGISLTIAAVEGAGFTVAVIPHTFQHTTLAERRAGDRVNLEVDVIARYLERLLADGPPSPGGLTLTRLRSMGY